jgi:hypothetical protein
VRHAAVAVGRALPGLAGSTGRPGAGPVPSVLTGYAWTRPGQREVRCPSGCPRVLLVVGAVALLSAHGDRSPGHRPAAATGAALRLTYTVVIVAALFSAPWLASEAGRRIGGRPWAHWPSPTLVLLVLGALVASRVSYRWFDAFLLLIPIVGLFYLWRFAWRLSFLPYRDWPPRPEEAPSWRKVAHPDRPGAGLYLVDRTGQRERPDGS